VTTISSSAAISLNESNKVKAEQNYVLAVNVAFNEK
jgi:hypothetical protein